LLVVARCRICLEGAREVVVVVVERLFFSFPVATSKGVASRGEIGAGCRTHGYRDEWAAAAALTSRRCT